MLFMKMIHKVTDVFKKNAFCHIEISSILDKLFMIQIKENKYTNFYKKLYEKNL